MFLLWVRELGWFRQIFSLIYFVLVIVPVLLLNSLFGQFSSLNEEGEYFFFVALVFCAVFWGFVAMVIGWGWDEYKKRKQA